MLRKKLAVLVATAMMLAMTLASGAALADNGKHTGAQSGGGDIAHADQGKHKANGGGKSNNPHNSCVSC